MSFGGVLCDYLVLCFVHAVYHLVLSFVHGAQQPEVISWCS
jgi:hypothetical protein